jgi:hypothetical protein
MIVSFSDGTQLEITYWRVIQNGKAQFTSFDHGQQYGRPVPIDAKARLANLLNGKTCEAVQFDRETADLILTFAQSIKLHVFNFTGYEIWHISFPDGTGEYSNYA